MREEAIRRERERRDSDNGMLTDEFFRTVWQAPAKEEPSKEETSESESAETETDTPVQESETAENSNEKTDDSKE